MSAISLEDALNEENPLSDENLPEDPKAEDPPADPKDGDDDPQEDPKAEDPKDDDPSPAPEDELPDDVRGLKQALAAKNAQVASLKETVAGFQGKLEAFERFAQPPQNPQGTQKTPEELEEERDEMLAELADNPDEFIKNRVYETARALKRQDDVEEMVATHSDYEETIRVFQDAAKNDEALVAEFNAARNQAKFAYQKGKQIQRFKNLGVNTLEEYEEKLKAKWEAEQAEKDKAAAQVDKAGAVPPSTATARGGSAAPQPAFTGPPSLDELLPE